MLRGFPFSAASCILIFSLFSSAARAFDFVGFSHGEATTGDSPVITAVKAGNLAALTALLDSGADVNARNAFGLSALHVVAYPKGAGGLAAAAEDSRLEMARELLEAGADLHAADGLGMTPLLLAEGRHLEDRVFTNYYSAKLYEGVWDLKVRAHRTRRAPPSQPARLILTRARAPPPPLHLISIPHHAQVSSALAELIQATARDDEL